jgi:hypothetical protein
MNISCENVVDILRESSFAFSQGGATLGFVGGMVHRWRTDLKEARFAMLAYPELMEHHIKAVSGAMTVTHLNRRDILAFLKMLFERLFCEEDDFESTQLTFSKMLFERLFCEKNDSKAPTDQIEKKHEFQ